MTSILLQFSPPHSHFTHTLMGTIDFFQSLTSLTAAFPILLPNQPCHLCALLFLLSCQEFPRKLNNHADWLCYNFMISHVSWTQSSSAAGLLIPTWQVSPFHTAAAPTTPSLGAHPHLCSLHSPHRSPPPTESIQARQLWTPHCPSSVSLYLSESLLICTTLYTREGFWVLCPSDLMWSYYELPSTLRRTMFIKYLCYDGLL